jgi:hypothetical protein
MNLSFAATTCIERSDLPVLYGAKLLRTKRVDARCLDRRSITFCFWWRSLPRQVCSPLLRIKALLFRSDNSMRKATIVAWEKMSATLRAIGQVIQMYIAQLVKGCCEARSVTRQSVNATILDEFDVIARERKPVCSYIFLFEGIA